jgi:hypothetical protein
VGNHILKPVIVGLFVLTILVAALVVGFWNSPQASQITGTFKGVACSDGRDNDLDGLIDMADPGCLNERDTNEYNPKTTTPTTSSTSSTAATPTPLVNSGVAECSDGIDNDGDGFSDWPGNPGNSSAGDPQCAGPRDRSERYIGNQ